MSVPVDACSTMANPASSAWTDDAKLLRLESLLVGAQNLLARVLRRWHPERSGLSAKQYGELLEWAAHMRITRGQSIATAQNYVGDAAEFLCWMNTHGRPFEAITVADMETWLRELYLERRQSSKTRGEKLFAARNFYRWRKLDGRGDHPLDAIPGPARQKRLPRPYNDRQMMGLFAACDRNTAHGRRDLALLLFFYSTGARRAEVARLSLGDIELRERVGLVRIHGKGAKERVVSFEGPVIDALRAWFADRDALDAAGELIDRDALFLALSRNRGQRLTEKTIESWIVRLAMRAKVRDEGVLGVHRIRAAYATELYNQGRDVREIQHVLGHENINTTLAYIAVSRRQLKVRMAGGKVKQLLGESDNDTPLWFRHKLAGRARKPAGNV